MDTTPGGSPVQMRFIGFSPTLGCNCDDNRNQFQEHVISMRGIPFVSFTRKRGTTLRKNAKMQDRN